VTFVNAAIRGLVVTRDDQQPAKPIRLNAKEKMERAVPDVFNVFALGMLLPFAYFPARGNSLKRVKWVETSES
jgi:hypothetical protein